MTSRGNLCAREYLVLILLSEYAAGSETALRGTPGLPTGRRVLPLSAPSSWRPVPAATTTTGNNHKVTTISLVALITNRKEHVARCSLIGNCTNYKLYSLLTV